MFVIRLKFRKMKKYFYSLLILAAVSCTAMPDASETNGNGSLLITKVSGGDFSVGDKIGLFMFEESDTPYGGRVVADNLLVEITGSGASLDGTVFFPDSRVDMFAYYPYWDDSYILDNFLSVYTYEDQRPLEQYRESEHKFVKFLGYENTGKPVELAFERLVGRLSFELIPGDGFSSADELMDCEIVIPNIKYNSGIFIETGELKEPEGNRDFFPYVDEMAVADGKVSGIYAMIVPQRLPKGASIANIRIGNDVFRCILDNDFTICKGVNYTVSLTLEKSATKGPDAVCGVSWLSISESPWE